MSLDRPVYTCDCITCSDEAVAMRVLALDAQRGLALCADDGDRHQTVEIGLVEPVGPGDRVLVHAAVAIAVLGGPDA